MLRTTFWIELEVPSVSRPQSNTYKTSLKADKEAWVVIFLGSPALERKNILNEGDDTI